MIDSRTARRIAGDWHSGGGSALYALASSGAIRADEAVAEISEDLDWTEANPDAGPPNGPSDAEDLRGLLAYVEHHGERSEIPGWGILDF